METTSRERFLRDMAIAHWVGDYLTGPVTNGESGESGERVTFTQEEMAQRAREAIQLAAFLFNTGQIKPDPDRYPA